MMTCDSGLLFGPPCSNCFWNNYYFSRQPNGRDGMSDSATALTSMGLDPGQAHLLLSPSR